MKINHIITEFVTPQATAQDPGLEREKDVDVIIFGRMPQDFTANTVAEALEEVLPREYPPGSSNTTNSNVYRVVTEIAKHQGAVVTTKPLSIAQKLVKTFQTYGIKCKIDGPGLEEDITRRGFLQGAGAAAAGAAGGAKAGGIGLGTIIPVYTDSDPPLPRTVKMVWNYFSPDVLTQDDKNNIVKLINLLYFAKMAPEEWRDSQNGRIIGNATPSQIYKQCHELLIFINDAFANLDFPKVMNGQKDKLENLYKNDPAQFKKLQEFFFSKWETTVLIGNLLKRKLTKANESVDHGMAEAARPPIAPDPQNYDSDWDYYNDRDADDMTDSDPADDMTDDESDDWFDESKEKVGNMDADAFDAALARMKKLAGAGPLKTVYDPARRVYKNVPHAVQPAQQPKKVR
jgi:hypothetical protein